MRRLPNLQALLRRPPFALRFLLSMAGLLSAFALLPAAAAPAQQSAVPDQNLFPTVPVKPMASTPLTGSPYVFRLKHLVPAEMSAQDAAVVSASGRELGRAAALFNFDLDGPSWSYHQISCPAFPDYVLLAYGHPADPAGVSRFVAVLSRSGRPAVIIPSVTRGVRLTEGWKNPSTYAVFNRILMNERGPKSLRFAPNWLVISMCYAELTGKHVQAFTSQFMPDASLDLMRLGARLPQVNMVEDGSAVVTFSDASVPRRTTNWALSYDREGQLTSVTQDSTKQPKNLALRP